MVAENYGNPTRTALVDYLTWAKLNREGRSSGPANFILKQDAELAQARADIAERDAKLAVVLNALNVFIEWHGAAHEAGCPEDDTCSCAGKPVNDFVNAALRALPAQAKALLTLAEAAKNHVANKNVQWAVSGVPTFIALADALSTLSRPDGDGR